MPRSIVPLRPESGDPAPSALDADATLQAMVAELERSMRGLRLPENPRPYHMLYSLRRIESAHLRAAHGSLLRDRNRCASRVYADVRVGNHRFDNVYDGGLETNAAERESADWLDAPDDLDPAALRYALWKLSQIKFDEAIEDYYDHRKAEVSEYLRDEVESFSRERPTVHVEALDETPFPLDAFREGLTELSARFLDHPEVIDPYVDLHFERVSRWLCTSEGTRVIDQNVYVEFAVTGWVLTDDGVYVEAQRQVLRRALDELPSIEEMGTALDEVLAELAELETARSPGSFIGPALLAGQAASTMFHEALGHRLEGERLVARGETRTFSDRRGDRILPEGLSVYDDPTIAEVGGQALYGSYRVDDQGVPAQRARLVEDGVLVGFLQSRQPIPRGPRSNGHARHDGVAPPMARMGNLIVEGDPRQSESWEALEAKLIEMAREQGHREAAVICQVSNGETATESYDFQVFKGELSEVYLIDVETGQRRRIRDVELIGTPLSALQRIVAYGGEAGIDQGFCYAESGSVPVSGVAPAILLSEVELQQRSSAGYHEPLLPPPFADDGSRGRVGGRGSRGRRKRG